MLRLLLLCFSLAGLPAFGQSGFQISDELKGIISATIDDVRISADGKSVIIVQSKQNNQPATRYEITFGANAKATPTALPARPDPPVDNKEFLLATLSDGRILTSSASKSKEFSAYANPKKLENIYLYSNGKRNLLWKGEVSLLNHQMVSLLSPDEKNFIWRNAGTAARVLTIENGSVKTLDPGIAALEMSIYSKNWIANNDYLLLCGKTNQTSMPYVLQLIDLKTGVKKDEQRLETNYSLAVVGDSLVYALNPSEGKVVSYNISKGSLVQQARHKVDLGNLPVAYSRHGAPYSFIPMQGNKLLIYPTSPLQSYIAGDFNPGLLLYNLQANKLEKVWPDIMQGAGDKKAAYLAFKPRVITEDTAALAVKPLNSAERCTENKKRQKWAVGTCFQKGTDRAIIVGFECYDGSYTIADMSWNAIGKYWQTAKYHALEQALDFKYGQPIHARYGLCKLCNATGVLNKKKIYTRESRIVLLNFTDYVRTPAYELHTWEKETCDVCNGEAWLQIK